jgi:alpha-beta hydrolase superfamily lysophospholipase
MKFLIIATPLLLGAAFVSCTTMPPHLERQPQSEISSSPLYLEKVRINGLQDSQRMGFLTEAPQTVFKGCVIFLEGLGDSMRNHYPLFNKLNNAGYRVLLFDYLGQGGSEGSMNTTRVWAAGDPFPRSEDHEIGNQARFVWERYSDRKNAVYNRTCADSPKRVIGWSTGGLAAYKLAFEKWADGVVLIAPGIVPNYCVGESAGSCAKNITRNTVITKATLTRNIYAKGYDPHLDPIKPTSIVYDVPEFATNLITTSFKAREWSMPAETKGLVFLSGTEDTYVDRDETMKVLSAKAPSFQVVAYDGALHEIDNEAPAVANDMHARTIEFLDSIPLPR